MRVVFLGTPHFAVPTLRLLSESDELEVAGVVTQPDRPAGRGKVLSPSPIKKLALKKGIPVYQSERIKNNREAVEWVAQHRPDIMVVVAFGQILPPGFFDLPPLGTLNVHASLLPFYRGAAPIIHALLNGETRTGVTIMKLDEGMDTGDILVQEEVEIPKDMSAGELESLLAERGARLLVETVRPYAEGRITPRPQDNGRATYAPRISKDQARIDWSHSATDIHNQVRAFNPRPGAFTSLREGIVKIWRTGIVKSKRSYEKQAGKIIEAGDELLVSCGGSGDLLSIREMQAANRSRVSAKEFVNGMRLISGERFY